LPSICRLPGPRLLSRCRLSQKTLSRTQSGAARTSGSRRRSSGGLIRSHGTPALLKPVHQPWRSTTVPRAEFSLAAKLFTFFIKNGLEPL
jgi:hypothetical protein